MSATCSICKSNHCGCGGGVHCSSCKAKIKAIESNPNLTQEQKQQEIAKLYVNH